MKTTIFNLIILDESGSMSGVTAQTISGCNETINTIKAAQKENADSQEHFISIYAFQGSGSYPSRYLIKNQPAEEAQHITSNDYQPFGSTPLYDAVGATLSDLKAKAKKCEDAVGSITIITDGYENASREYSGSQVVKMIDELKELGWNFNFIGADIDVHATAMRFHIDNAMQFDKNEESMDSMFERERCGRRRWFEKMKRSEGLSKEEILVQRCEASADFFSTDVPKPKRVAPGHIRSLDPDEVFVFGSNLKGMHGGGAARKALDFGAVMGQGVGMQGQTYAIPTMQGGVNTIKPYVDEFIEFAKNHPEKKFLVTRIGCGIAGFKDSQIAPLFKEALDVENIYLPKSFINVLENDTDLEF